MTPIAQSLVASFRYGCQLKQTARTGWVQRGIANRESVAAHSYGVAFTAMLLAQQTDDEIDIGRVLSLAVLHDLPEALTTDIPTPSWRILPEGAKEEAEDSAMEAMFADSPHREKIMDLWGELQAAESKEAKIVHDADKLDMYLQALIYAEQTGNVLLKEFWNSKPAFHLPISKEIYEVLVEQFNQTLGR
jgi:putative hydrolase of HD superfamily